MLLVTFNLDSKLSSERQDQQKWTKSIRSSFQPQTTAALWRNYITNNSNSAIEIEVCVFLLNSSRVLSVSSLTAATKVGHFKVKKVTSLSNSHKVKNQLEEKPHTFANC